MIVKTVYVCERCRSEHDLKVWVFKCYGCEQEICEDCMYGWGRCQTCAVGKTAAELQTLFDEVIS